MRIIAISDLHGVLPEIPECELLLIGGDLCPPGNYSLNFQAAWLDQVFRAWLESLPLPPERIIGIAGNHDFVMQEGSWPQDLPWTYLQDSGCQVEGLQIWGSPWQPTFHCWAFNLDLEEELAARWALIPAHTDILLLHGPPRGLGDRTLEGAHIGSLSLRERLLLLRPRLTVWGHIHEAYGRYDREGMILANAALVDLDYQPINPPTLIELSARPPLS